MMLYTPLSIVEEVSSFLTLEDGDLIMTGTPEGVGPLLVGDNFIGKIFYKEQLLLETRWTVK
jgi:2-keto-4-pentenoate hydratase/2-oxohepta-3-ene-1,7-dioic acid hydratase in catechol pathway